MRKPCNIQAFLYITICMFILEIARIPNKNGYTLPAFCVHTEPGLQPRRYKTLYLIYFCICFDIATSQDSVSTRVGKMPANMSIVQTSGKYWYLPVNTGKYWQILDNTWTKSIFLN